MKRTFWNASKNSLCNTEESFILFFCSVFLFGDSTKKVKMREFFPSYSTNKSMNIRKVIIAKDKFNPIEQNAI